MLYLLVVMPLKVLAFGSTRAAVKFSGTVLVVRSLLIRKWLVHAVGETQTFQRSHLVCSRVIHGKKVMADNWFFDDDILRLEAWALVQAAERAAHSQPVHDCKFLLPSDNLSIVLCFTRGRSRDIRLLTQIRRFCISMSGAQHQDQRQMDTEQIQQQRASQHI